MGSTEFGEIDVGIYLLGWPFLAARIDNKGANLPVWKSCTAVHERTFLIDKILADFNIIKWFPV
jgi:hypothetical protein